MDVDIDMEDGLTLTMYPERIELHQSLHQMIRNASMIEPQSQTVLAS